jgi:hypothetical protein
MVKVNTIPTSKLKIRLRSIRKAIAKEDEWFLITRWDKPVGFLLPVRTATCFSLKNIKTVPISLLRQDAGNAWLRLKKTVDCYYLTCRSNLVMALISPRLESVVWDLLYQQNAEIEN